MKIISKFQDYYDVGLAYGIDEKLRFERVTRVVQEDCLWGEPLSCSVFKNQKRVKVWFFFDAIGFCGEIYPFIKVEIEGSEREEYFYDLESFEIYLKEHISSTEKIMLENIGYKFGLFGKKHSITNIAKEYFSEKFWEYKKIFELYDVAYFVVESSKCIKNDTLKEMIKTILYPQLKKYRFSKVLSAMEAFEKLSMYLGAKQAEKEIEKIDDKYLAKGKGFDCYSFKKLPKKRGVKRC